MERSIKIRIADKEYSLMATSPEMEQMYRIAAETINQRLAAYDAKFPGKPVSDKLAFVAIIEAVNRLMSQKELSKAKNEAAKLEEDIESYLKEIEENGR
ncbi:MAG: cell division protein ZapA [Candidatus Cryptobacteroides sp.]